MAELTPQLQRLRRMLEESDTEASELAAMLQRSADEGLRRALLRVQQRLEQYDFDAALEALDIAMDQA